MLKALLYIYYENKQIIRNFFIYQEVIVKNNNFKRILSAFSAVLILLVLMSCATTGASGDSRQTSFEALTVKQQKVVSIAAFTAAGDLDKLRTAVNEGLDSGLTVNEIGEVVLQLYAYAGFPRSLNSMGVLSDVLAKRQAAGKRDVFGREPDFLPENTDKYASGVSTLADLMGFPYKKEKPESNGYNDAMDVFLKEHLFADIFGRNNLPFDMRELATVSALCSMDGTSSQLLFHMNAAMNLGITEQQMFEAVEIIRNGMGAEKGDNAETVLLQVLDRRKAKGAKPAGGGAGYSYIPEMFPKGKLSGNTTIFTGNSWVAPLVPFDAGGVPVVNVTFEPDARTKWHAHSYMQILLVTLGDGYYQEDGKEPVKLKPGDTVTIPAGVKHWHGSAPGRWFSHIAIIVPVENGGEDLWLGPVSDDEYMNLD